MWYLDNFLTLLCLVQTLLIECFWMYYDENLIVQQYEMIVANPLMRPTSHSKREIPQTSDISYFTCFT